MQEASIKAQSLSGFRDFLPEKMVVRQYVIDTLRQVFERHGFEPLETPALEYAETLEGKYGEDEHLLYRFAHGDRNVGLRYDLTVPLARVVGQHAAKLTFPFKRYQIQPVWRAERPQKGRYREFYQCDVDIVGSSSPLADAEVISINYEGLRDLGFSNYYTQLNSRKLLTAIGLYAGAGEQAAGIFRAIDKLPKIGAAGVLETMAKYGIADDVARRALDLALLSKGRRDQADDLKLLADLRQRFAAIPEGVAGVDELSAVVRILPHLLPDSAYAVDLTLARGLNYYTGAVFETVVVDGGVGSVTGGGRYDELVGMFSGRNLPTVGTSFGLERLIDIIEGRAGQQTRKTLSQVFVSVFNEASLPASLMLAGELRAAGLNVEVAYDYQKGDLGKQLKYAAARGIPLALILGPDEQAQDLVQLRTIAAEGGAKGEIAQQAVPRSEIAAALRARLNLRADP